MTATNPFDRLGLVKSSTATSAPAAPRNPFDKLGLLSKSSTGTKATSEAPASILEQIGGALDLPFIANNAQNRGELGQAMRSYLHSPAQANREYGLMAPHQLEYERTHDVGVFPGLNRAGAKFFQEHPKAAGTAAFVTEFYNPANKVVGPALGIANAGAKLVPGVAKMQAALAAALGRTFNLFHDVHAVAGAEGEAAARDLTARIAEFQQTAQEHVKGVFGGLSPAQQRLVVHVYQDPRLVRQVPAPIAARAQELQNVLQTLDRSQQALGLLAPERQFTKARYFPMRGAYTNSEYDEAELDLLGGLRQVAGTPAGPRVVKGTAGAAGGHKTFFTLAEAERSNLLKPDFLPANQLLGHLQQRYGNVALEYGLRQLPASLRADRRFVDALGNEATTNPFRQTREDLLATVERNQGETGPGALHRQPMTEEDRRYWEQRGENPFTAAARQPHGEPAYPKGHPLRLEQVRPGEHFYGEDVLRNIGSPTLRDSTVHPALVKYLQRTAANLDDADRAGFLKVVDSFNKFARIGIISNPAVHVGWNLTFNYLGAGGSWMTVAKVWMKTARAISEAMTGKAVTAAERTAPRIAEPTFGATRPMFGSDEARLLTLPTEKLTTLEKADRLATNLWEKNQQIVFDVAEREFASDLFKRLAPTMGNDKAAIAVRKALGDYANVERSSLANRAFIFYPWLKTVLPFWARTLVTNPQHVTAPVRGIRTTNQLVDPDFNKRKTAAPDFQLELGKDKAGAERMFSVPHPARILSQALTPVESALGGGDVAHALSGPQKVGESHLNPFLASGYDVLDTMLSRSQDPAAGGSFRTAFDKAAPAGEQMKQLGQFGVGRAAGVVPFAIQAEQFPGWVRDIHRGGMGPEDLLGYGGGTVFRRPAQNVQRALFALHGELERHQISYDVYKRRRDTLLSLR